MANNFKPYNQSLEDLFLFKFKKEYDKERKYTFFIPDYQRQYSWVTKNVEDLWKDFYDGYYNNIDSYFLGFITLIKPENSKKYHVIDGQQRITTLVILLAVLYKEFKDKLEENLYQKIENYLYRKIEPDELLIFESDNDNNHIFKEKITDKGIPLNNIEEISKSELKQNKPECKYRNTARYFYKKLSQLSKDDLNKFIKYIFTKVNVITIVTKNEKSALKIFESQNDRGLGLENADIFKAWLYSLCHDEDTLITDLKKYWEKTLKIANEYDFTMNDLITYFTYYKLKSNPKSNAATELKKYFKEQEIGVSKISKEIHDFATKIDTVFKEKDRYAWGLTYIPWKSYAMTSLAALGMSNYSKEEKQLITKIMHKFFFTCLITNTNVSIFKQTAFNLIKYIAEERKIEDIEEMLLDFIYGKYNNIPRIEILYKNLRSDNVYDTSFLKPLMLSVDYFYEKKERDKYEELNKEVQIDHIIPQKYLSNLKDWSYLIENNSKKEIKKVNNKINTLGNMALLSAKMNISANNYGFETKRKIYLGKYENDKNNGDNKKEKTSFKTTQPIIKEKTWTLDHVEKRCTMLIKLISEVLSLDEENDKKIKYETKGSNLERNIWYYNGNYYHDKDMIIKILKTNNKKLKEIKNKKMLSYNVITYKNELDIARESITINGQKLYILKSYLPDISRKLIESLNVVKYDEKNIIEKNRELYETISKEILKRINKKHNNEYKTNDNNYKVAKSFIQFYKKEWNKGKREIYFEIIQDSIKWFDKRFSLDIVLRGNLDKNEKNDKKFEKLATKKITFDEESNNIAIHDNKPVKITIPLNFEIKDSKEETASNINNQIELITNNLEYLIKEYSKKIDEAVAEAKAEY